MKKYKLQGRIVVVKRLCLWTAALFSLSILALNIGVLTAWAAGALSPVDALGMVKLPWILLVLAAFIGWLVAREGPDPLPGILPPDPELKSSRASPLPPQTEYNPRNGAPMMDENFDVFGNMSGRNDHGS